MAVFILLENDLWIVNRPLNLQVKSTKKQHYFLGVPWRAGCYGLRFASVLRCSPHWLTPPSTSLTRFAIRTIDSALNKKTVFGF